MTVLVLGYAMIWQKKKKTNGTFSLEDGKETQRMKLGQALHFSSLNFLKFELMVV